MHFALSQISIQSRGLAPSSSLASRIWRTGKKMSAVTARPIIKTPRARVHPRRLYQRGFSSRKSSRDTYVCTRRPSARILRPYGSRARARSAAVSLGVECALSNVRSVLLHGRARRKIGSRERPPPVSSPPSRNAIPRPFTTNVSDARTAYVTRVSSPSPSVQYRP